MVSFDTVFAVVGVILSNSLYFNTLPKMLAIFREGSLDNFNPLPIVVMLLNAVAWILYGGHVSSNDIKQLRNFFLFFFFALLNYVILYLPGR